MVISWPTYRDIAAFANKPTIGHIGWFHRANSFLRLKKYLDDNRVQAIEGDIFINASGKPIMAHPPQTNSRLDFETWITLILKANKIAKLDFKTPQVVKTCLEILKHRQKRLKTKVPIVLNADVIRGPLGKQPVFDGYRFVSICRQYFPEAVISLGWTTGFKNQKTNLTYSLNQLNQMRSLINSCSGLITLPIRVCYYQTSFTNLQPFIQEKRVSLSFWNSEDIPYHQLKFLQNQTNLTSSFYDLIDSNLKPLFLFAG